MPLPRFYVYSSDQVIGPLDYETIQTLLKTGKIAPTDPAMVEGQKNWEPLAPLIYRLLQGMAEENDVDKGKTTGPVDPNRPWIQSRSARVLMDRINKLDPGDFVRSDTSRLHFRDVVPGFADIGAQRRGSKEIETSEGHRFVLDIYILPDGREILAGYMSPDQRAELNNLHNKPPGESIEQSIKRLMLLHLNIDESELQFSLEFKDDFGEFGLDVSPLDLIDLMMACEKEFGMEIDSDTWCEITAPNYPVPHFIDSLRKIVEG